MTTNSTISPMKTYFYIITTVFYLFCHSQSVYTPALVMGDPGGGVVINRYINKHLYLLTAILNAL